MTYISPSDVHDPLATTAQIEDAIRITVIEFEAAVHRNSVYQQQSLLDACIANDPKSQPIKKLIATLVEGQLLLRRGGRPELPYIVAQQQLVEITKGSDIFGWGLSRPPSTSPPNLRKGPRVFNRMMSESGMK